MCVFVSRPMKIDAFLRKKRSHTQNGLLIFFGKETHSETKSSKSSRTSTKKVMDIVRDLRVKPNFFIFHCSSFLIFLFFNFFHFFVFFSFFLIFSFFSFLYFFHFLKIFIFSFFLFFHFSSCFFFFLFVSSFFLHFSSFFLLFFFSFSFSFLGCSKSNFFGLNCFKISCNISFHKKTIF